MDGMLCHDLVTKRWINPDIQASPNPSNKRHLPPAERRWPSSVSPFSNSDPRLPPCCCGGFGGGVGALRPPSLRMDCGLPSLITRPVVRGACRGDI